MRGYYREQGSAEGVTVHALDPEDHARGEHGDRTSIGPCLEALYRLADTCSENLAYQLVINDYRHLATGCYQLRDRRTQDGRRLSRAEVVHRRCAREPEGRNGLWERWRQCLAELDRHDYRTLIVVDER
ncbi:MAG: hypothetical protein GWO02_04640 [Gammaproteobacteria bacterium]|nr:hypothetical protein [Gammaproteobacteria bacterium]